MVDTCTCADVIVKGSIARMVDDSNGDWYGKRDVESSNAVDDSNDVWYGKRDVESSNAVDDSNDEWYGK